MEKTKYSLEAEEIVAALAQFHEMPVTRCAGCGKKRTLRVTGIARGSREESPWMVTNATYKDEEGWAAVTLQIRVVGKGNEKHYCPGCVEKFGIGVGKE